MYTYAYTCKCTCATCTHQRTSLSPDDVLEVHYVQDGLEVIVSDPLTMHVLHGVRVYHLVPQAA